MGYIYKNIEGTTAVLLSKVNYKTPYNMMSLCNTDSSVEAKVSVYFQTLLVTSGSSYNDDSDENTIKTPTLYYIIKDVTIPVGATLILDKTYFLNMQYKIYVKLADSGSKLSVILN